MASMPVPHTHLTEIEREVLYWVACGLSNKEIAKKLVRSCDTVRSHIARIMVRLDAINRTHAVKRGYDLGYLVVDELAAYRPAHDRSTAE